MAASISDSEFSITRGGLLYRLLIKIGIIRPEKKSAGAQILFFIGLCYLPLLLLSLWEGYHWDSGIDVPFLKEFATAIRFLLVIPLLIIAEAIVDKRVKLTLGQFERSGMITSENRAKFESSKIQADQWTESIWADVVIILLIVLNLLIKNKINTLDLTTWAFPYAEDPYRHSLAGNWAAFVSFPVFQFILWRWIWRWVIWSRMLRMISRADLSIIPTHPDRSGGLGFLGEPPMPFSIFTLGLSLLFSGILAERVIFQGLFLQDHYGVIILFALICILINLLPLHSFIQPLNAARIKGIYTYHALIARHHRAFDRKWIRDKDKAQEEILGSPDASSAADIQAVYEAVKKMTVFPFDLKTMAATLGIVLFPLLFVFALQIPLAEVLKKLIGILF